MSLMQHLNVRRARIFGYVAATLFLLLVTGMTYRLVFAQPTIYYVDCSAIINGNGTENSPWNSLTPVNSTTFAPGNQVLFKRGTTCTGALAPRGSGSAGSPITFSSYGNGAHPIISAGTNPYAFKLFNQQYWVIQNLEFAGGTIHGITISGDQDTALTYFRLTNLTVRDVTGGSYANMHPFDGKATGLVVIASVRTSRTRFHDVVIDGVNAYNSTMWSGIMVNNNRTSGFVTDFNLRNLNVTIRNSTVHDVWGDGIVSHGAREVLLENNVAYRTGLQPPPVNIGTPTGIWTWACYNCVVQGNESYENDSPGVDGGGFDIDYFNDYNTVQYNYGHDNSTYCVSIFGAENYVTVGSVIRYNICANNGLNPAEPGSSEIYLSTWNGGAINDVQIYNNTFYAPRQIFSGSNVTFSGNNPRFFKNNLIYSPNANPLGVNFTQITRDYNLWYYTGGSWSSGEPNSIHNQNPNINDPTYSGIGRPTTQFTLQSNSPAIDRGTNVCAGISGCSMGNRDFYGNPIPSGTTYDIGAHEYSAGQTTNIIVDNTDSGFSTQGTWTSSTFFTNRYGANYVHDGDGVATPTKWARWTPNIPTSGSYKLYMWWSASADRPDAAPLVIAHSNGTDTSKTVNQQTNGGTWVLIGQYNLSAGTSNYIQILADDAGFTIADAVKFELVTVFQPPTNTPSAPTSTPIPSTNLVGNPSFETGSFSPWGAWPTANGDVVANNAQSGTYAGRLFANESGIYQVINNLTPNSTYTVTAWLKAGSTGNSGYLYAKNFGGTAVNSTIISSTTYTQVTIQFTTGASNTSVEIGLWRRNTHGTGEFFIDNVTMVKQ
jgi:hypothetical protein